MQQIRPFNPQLPHLGHEWWSSRDAIAALPCAPRAFVMLRAGTVVIAAGVGSFQPGARLRAEAFEGSTINYR